MKIASIKPCKGDRKKFPLLFGKFASCPCFNGLYRVNGKGLFNVPYNQSRGVSVDEELIRNISKYLRGVTIIDGDFEDACVNAAGGDFVFLDSPYAPLNPTSFESYTKEGFDIESHRRLARLYDELTAGGCYCMLTNHNTEFINELYGDKGYTIDVVKHPTQKPEYLLERMVLASSAEGQVILDPFYGSGTTGVVAVRFNRKFMGIDVSEEYLKIARRRLEKTADGK